MCSEGCWPSGARLTGDRGAPGCEICAPIAVVCAASGREGGAPSAGRLAAGAAGLVTGLWVLGAQWEEVGWGAAEAVLGEEVAGVGAKPGRKQKRW